MKNDVIFVDNGKIPIRSGFRGRLPRMGISRVVFCYLVTLLHRFSKGEAEIPGEFSFLDFVVSRRKRLL